MSFLTDKVVSEGLTFDDVLLIPSYSEVLPREVDLQTKFTRNYPVEYTGSFGSHGYGYRVQTGDSHCQGRRYRSYSHKTWILKNRRAR
jgi:hypothetical protein